ncbi:unnamed protein product [Heterobilharzia americana]|nr:unnamed protein product [Heterobilharzia americana]
METECDVNPWDIRPVTQSLSCKSTVPLQVQFATRLKKNFVKKCLPHEESLGVDTTPRNSSESSREKENVVKKLQGFNSPCADNSYLPTQLKHNHTLKETGNVLLRSPVTNNSDTSLYSNYHCQNSTYLQVKSASNNTKGDLFRKPLLRPTAIESHMSWSASTKRGSLLGHRLVDEVSPLVGDHSVTNLSATCHDPLSSTDNTNSPKSSEALNVNVTSDTDTNLTVIRHSADDTVSRFEKSVSKSNRSLPVHNYVKLNLKKKQFCKKGSSRQRALRRQVYLSKLKKKFKKGSYQKRNTCFTCGATGHWANKCPLTIMKPKTPAVSNSLYLQKCNVACKTLSLSELDDRYCQPHLDDVFPADFSSGSLRESQLAMSVDELSLRMQSCLKQFGFNSFRSGQELVILRTLLGVSTLSVMPTASGKSLCYQIPAVIHQQINGKVALVISPLISLMQDQVLPSIVGIQGAYLNSSQSADYKRETLEEARRGKYSFLMLSPEAIVDSDWLLQSGSLPPISFVCIDEAHCLADWSNHFRPSYLRVCNILRRYMGVTCFLGLSATCTPNVIQNICENLGIINPTKFIGDKIDETTLYQPGYVQPVVTPLPSHLTISASMDNRKDEALLRLLISKPFSQLSGGVLIYCATREQTERLASYIRTALQEVVDKVGRKRMSWTTAAYHAGQTTNERSRIQKKFMNGKIRVLIATCAFGMGLNKPDLQAVIHYSLTKSFENYIQEIGRVGRKQQASYCHAFLPSSLVNDPCEANNIRRHIFVNNIDLVLLKRLLALIFKDFQCICRRPIGTQRQDQMPCQGHVHTINLQSISEQVDIKPESLATILAYMELEPDNPILSMLHSSYTVATVDFHGNDNEIAYASQRCLAIASALSLWQNEQIIENNMLDNQYPRQLKLNLPQLFNRWGWKPNVVRKELKNLEWDSFQMNNTSGEFNKTYRTGISVNFSQWNLWLWIHGSQVPITNERLNTCLTYLNKRLQQTEKAALHSIEQLTLTLGTVAQPTFEDVYPLESNNDIKVKFSENLLESNCTEYCKQQSLVVHELIKSHFAGINPTLSNEMLVILENCRSQFHWPPNITESQGAQVQSTVRDFLRVHESSLDMTITGRILANIFHGISTPQFPASTWSHCHRFWKAHMNIDWPTLKKIATQELLNHFTCT